MEIDMSEFAQMKPVAIRRFIVEHYIAHGVSVSISAVAKHFSTSPAFVHRCCEPVCDFDFFEARRGRKLNSVTIVEPSKSLLLKLLREARASQNT
jgi:hypothetical protein